MEERIEDTDGEIADRTFALLLQYIHNDSFKLIITIKLFLFFPFLASFSRHSFSSFCYRDRVWYLPIERHVRVKLASSLRPVWTWYNELNYPCWNSRRLFLSSATRSGLAWNKLTTNVLISVGNCLCPFVLVVPVYLKIFIYITLDVLNSFCTWNF